jgi:hypothetical protein
MKAIPPEDRGEHHHVTRRVVAAATEICESANGIALRLSADDYETAVQFVARERLCCPFLRFTLKVTPGRGPVWLCLDGPSGTGEFLRSELHLTLSLD